MMDPDNDVRSGKCPGKMHMECLLPRGHEGMCQFVDRGVEETKSSISFGPEIGKRTRYASLANVLYRAYDQAANGKGAERHAQGLPFEDQPMQGISKLLNSEDGLLYQAIKKAQEASRMEPEAAVRELLGAINYLAGAVVFIEHKKGPGV